MSQNASDDKSESSSQNDTELNILSLEDGLTAKEVRDIIDVLKVHEVKLDAMLLRMELDRKEDKKLQEAGDEKMKKAQNDLEETLKLVKAERIEREAQNSNNHHYTNYRRRHRSNGSFWKMLTLL